MPFLLVIALLSLQQPIDATALTFTIEKDSILVQVGRWKLRAVSTVEMNKFVDLHKKEIDPEKTVIYGDAKAPYESFQSVIGVLKKHDWLKFRLETTGPKHPAPSRPPSTRQI